MLSPDDYKFLALEIIVRGNIFILLIYNNAVRL